MRISLAGVVCVASLVAMSGSVAAEDHAIPPEQPSQELNAPTSEGPPPSRDVCTTVSWGFDDVVRTDCSYGLPPESRGNPALKGICMTLYGNRTCY
jgi:hypothetical protein